METERWGGGGGRRFGTNVTRAFDLMEDRRASSAHLRGAEMSSEQSDGEKQQTGAPPMNKIIPELHYSMSS